MTRMYNNCYVVAVLLAVAMSSSMQLVTHAFITTTTTNTPMTKYTSVVTTISSNKRRQRSSSRSLKLEPLFGNVQVARNGLSYEEVEIGTGRNIFPGDSILCYYVGSFKKSPFQSVTFDETDPGDPAEIVIGVGNVIPGWEIGICGDSGLDIPPMKIGGDRKLIIPAELAYGERGAGEGRIPPNTVLEFQIAILNAERKDSGVSGSTKLKGFAGLLGFFAFMLISLFVVTQNIDFLFKLL